MSILSDRWIKKMALEKKMIDPFIPEQKKDKVINFFKKFDEAGDTLLDALAGDE